MSNTNHSSLSDLISHQVTQQSTTTNHESMIHNPHPKSQLSPYFFQKYQQSWILDSWTNLNQFSLEICHKIQFSICSTELFIYLTTWTTKQTLKLILFSTRSRSEVRLTNERLLICCNNFRSENHQRWLTPRNAVCLNHDGAAVDGRYFQVNKCSIWLSKEGFSALGHSNWIFCIHLSPFFMEIFHLFHLHTGEPNLITPEGQ